MLYMDSISSSEFRKTYATLTEPTAVTALGRRIGVWMPAQVVDRADAELAAYRESRAIRETSELAAGIRPLRPAPKPSQKGK